MIDLSHEQGTLYLHNLYEILPQHRSENLTVALEKNWFDELQDHKQRASLIRTTVKTMGWQPALIGLYFMFSVSIMKEFDHLNDLYRD